MANYQVEFQNGRAIITGLEYFEPSQVFDCGQCFNFYPIEDGGYRGVVGNRVITVYKTAGNTITIHNVDEESFFEISRYLCLDDDYEKICKNIISQMQENGVDTKVMKSAMEMGKGIRLMRQDSWEALCSFIISQNNNIPRIKKIISTMSKKYGKRFIYNGEEYYTFPSPEALYQAGVDDIFECKTGFRAKYIYDAAKKVVTGETDLEKLDTLTTEQAAKELMKIKGVGPKVASCVLLFGYGKKDAFPIDVWVKKVLEKYFDTNFSPNHMGQYSGVAQQYLFYYERYLISKDIISN